MVWTGPVPTARNAFAWVSSPDGAVEPNRLFFARLRELDFHGTLEVQTVRTSATTARVDLVAHGFCYAARVLNPVPGLVFDANYIDLRDGERRAIEVSRVPEDFEVASLQARTYAKGHAGA